MIYIQEFESIKTMQAYQQLFLQRNKNKVILSQNKIDFTLLKRNYHKLKTFSSSEMKNYKKHFKQLTDIYNHKIKQK